ncbi:DegT/DnrJ/EryC1/StrS family aminotransferase [Rhodohalobacter sp. 8-1]|uniref:DegT/DnrJ/EryC1/StrS family aminotransferase n=1 Tax=Rhodohalobacter sp. 8-1 TaxID=3131972 RepID=UPI0030EDB25E
MRYNIDSLPPVNWLTYTIGFFKNGLNFQDVLLTLRGRDAIRVALKTINIQKDDVILLPALICNTVTGPISSSCKIKYYDLKKDYSINIEHINRLVNSDKNIRAIYVVHYFGFIQKKTSEIRDLCDKLGLILIDDHAHSALSVFDSNISDVSIFSFRKLLPTADGGGIQSKLNDKSLLNDFKPTLKSNLLGLIIGMKRLMVARSVILRKWVGKSIQKNIEQKSELATPVSAKPISRFASGIIKSADLNQISRKRRNQFYQWNSLMMKYNQIPVFDTLENGTVPYGFPVRLSNPKRVQSHFKKYSVYLKIHWEEMPQGLEKECPVSYQLVNNTITLPIHPGVTLEAMQFIAKEFDSIAMPMVGDVGDINDC